MKPVTANLINAAALICLSLWAYVANGMSSETTLIPVAFGILLLAHHFWLKAGSRVALFIVTLLTLVILIALYTPLSSSIAKGEILPILRVGLMTATSAIALFFTGKALLRK